VGNVESNELTTIGRFDWAEQNGFRRGLRRGSRQSGFRRGSRCARLRWIPSAVVEEPTSVDPCCKRTEELDPFL
jgi:hypothetical protein